MSVEIYSSVHIIGIILTFIGIVGMLFNKAIDLDKGLEKRLFAIIHGLGLVLALVAGFGMLAKLNLPFSGWVIGKLVIWLLLGLSPVFYRYLLLRGCIALIITLSIVAVLLVKFKPF